MVAWNELDVIDGRIFDRYTVGRIVEVHQPFRGFRRFGPGGLLTTGGGARHKWGDSTLDGSFVPTPFRSFPHVQKEADS